MFKVPKTRTDSGVTKSEHNRDRNPRLLAAAEASGWYCLVVWEC